ncbi:MAG: metallophosphoesterase [Candidatus Methylacidiphilales bacterium]|nr:metallophosphoesterase [Candidatus Methylacidiphilales bacterium]
MSLSSWLTFLSVVLSLLSLIHTFIAVHLWSLLPGGWPRFLLIPLFLFLGTAYVAGRALETHAPSLSTPLLHLGSWWLGAMTYLFLGCVVADVFLLTFRFLPGYAPDLLPTGRIYFITLGLLTAAVLFVGHLNVLFPAVRSVSLPRSSTSSFHSSIPPSSPLRLAVASDLHLCALVSPERLNRVVDQINELKPDLILLPGDVIDEDLFHTPRGIAFAGLLKQLRAPLGVIAVTGNHEWISGADRAVAWLESCGITVLRDQAVDLGPVVVAGREDIAGPRFGAGAGMSLAGILRGTDRSKPLIVLDHQPVRIPEAVEAGADLLLCGHTHHGQFWPFQWITQRLFPVSHGLRAFGQTQVYVSCGAGAWGPQVRTSSRSEIVLIEWDK